MGGGSVQPSKVPNKGNGQRKARWGNVSRLSLVEVTRRLAQTEPTSLRTAASSEGQTMRADGSGGWVSGARRLLCRSYPACFQLRRAPGGKLGLACPQQVPVGAPN